MILADLALDFKPTAFSPAPVFLTLSGIPVNVSSALPPATATPADLAELSADLGGFDAIPDDSPLWDEFAAEAECRDLMEAGVASW